jgi:hypothetical protein
MSYKEAKETRKLFKKFLNLKLFHFKYFYFSGFYLKNTVFFNDEIETGLPLNC